MLKDILKNIENADTQSEPYEHLIVDNLLPSDFYQRLAFDLEAERFEEYIRGEYGNKERFGVDITDYGSWENSKKNLATKIHDHNYNSLAKDSSLKVFFDLLLENKKDFYSALCKKLRTTKHKDNYFFHTSMVKDSLGYKIEKHTDFEQNIFTALFYAPQTDINKEFGLHVYKDAVTEDGVKLLDFIPNRMVAFAPCEENKDRPPTWHEVRRLSDELVGTRNSFQMFFYKNESGE